MQVQVQEEMQRRANLETGTGQKRVYSGKYALSHLVYRAHCGDIFRRSQWFIRGERIPVWRCVSRLEKKRSGIDCPSRTLYEKELQALLMEDADRAGMKQRMEEIERFLEG